MILWVNMIISLNTATALKFCRWHLICKVTYLFCSLFIQKLVHLTNTEHFISVIDPYSLTYNYAILPIYFAFFTAYTHTHTKKKPTLLTFSKAYHCFNKHISIYQNTDCSWLDESQTWIRLLGLTLLLITPMTVFSEWVYLYM